MKKVVTTSVMAAALYVGGASIPVGPGPDHEMTCRGGETSDVSTNLEVSAVSIGRDGEQPKFSYTISSPEGYRHTGRLFIYSDGNGLKVQELGELLVGRTTKIDVAELPKGQHSVSLRVASYKEDNEDTFESRSNVYVSIDENGLKLMDIQEYHATEVGSGVKEEE